MIFNEKNRTLFWRQGELHLLDQRKLPHEVTYAVCTDHHSVVCAIKDMIVRGAPAIGVTAAYGIALAAQQNQSFPIANFLTALQAAGGELIDSRPTAVNLRWAVARMLAVAQAHCDKPTLEITAQLIIEAEVIANEDIRDNYAISEHGTVLINDGARILTICNAGALATAGGGTALGVIHAAHAKGRNVSVFACETRPYLQGARLTTWELSQADIPVTLIVDSAAGLLFRQKMIDLVIVGADRIAANGDTANKIGTYPLSVLSKEHGIPFYVAAPLSTFDIRIASGNEIPIEERSGREITHIVGVQITSDEVSTYNPSFDITPVEKISAIITEQGIIYQPNNKKITELFSNHNRL